MFRRRTRIGERVQATGSGTVTEADSVETVLDSDGLLDVERTLALVMAHRRRRTPWVVVLPGMKRAVRSMLHAERDRQTAERYETGGADDERLPPELS